MFNLTGKVALVSGASRGLGWAMAQSLAAAGAHVILNARDESALKERVKEEVPSLHCPSLRRRRVTSQPIFLPT